MDKRHIQYSRKLIMIPFKIKNHDFFNRKTVVPEMTMYRDEYKWLASRATELLLNEETRQICIDGLKKVESIVGAPGASEKAADEDRFCPAGWRDRYGGLVWKTTS